MSFLSMTMKPESSSLIQAEMMVNGDTLWQLIMICESELMVNPVSIPMILVITMEGLLSISAIVVLIMEPI